MKILVVTWACDRDDVSEPQIAYRWVREISKHHEVVLFSVSRPDRFGCVKAQFPDISVIEWCDIRVPSCLERFRAIVKPGYFLYFMRARKFIKNLVKENEFDVIHHLNPFAWRYPSPAYGLSVPLIRGPLAGGLDTPEPLRADTSELFHPYKFFRISDKWRVKYDQVLKKSYRGTSCVLMAVPYVADLLNLLPVKWYEVEIEHGVDSSNCPDLDQAHHSDAKTVHLLFVGRIIRTKGVRDAIRAIFYMKTRKQVTFTIIGDGADLKSCQKLIKKLQLGDVVKCKGWCDSDEVQQAYQEADIFVFPSFREPTGGVILEAMLHALPCVVCAYGGPTYIVKEGCGLKVQPAEPETFARRIAAQIDRLVLNDNLRQKMGQKARQHALDNFNWDAKMDRLNTIYKSLSGRS